MLDIHRPRLLLAAITAALALIVLSLSLTTQTNRDPSYIPVPFSMHVVRPPDPPRTSRSSKPDLLSRFIRTARNAPYAAATPNIYTRWYADSQVGRTYGKRWRQNPSVYRNAPWCAMFVAWVANRSGVRLISSDAFTPTMASAFRKAGRWSTRPAPGSLAFFDWNGGRRFDGIDHVAIVTKVWRDGTFSTVEGNVSQRLARARRSLNNSVVGFARVL